MNFMNFASMGTYRAGIFRKYDIFLIASYNPTGFASMNSMNFASMCTYRAGIFRKYDFF